MKKLPKNLMLWIIGILFIMSVFPGQGTKAANQQALVMQDYSCETDTDCPKCVGGGIIAYNESDSNFFGDLSYAKCDAEKKKCILSDACLVWDCGDKQTQDGTCNSIKKTLLDNTIVKFNENPWIILFIIGLIVAFFML